MRQTNHTSTSMPTFILYGYGRFVDLWRSRRNEDGKKSQVGPFQFFRGYIILYRTGGSTFVPRVLEVEKGQLCFIIGTVYMDMPLKPNVLDDIARDVWYKLSSCHSILTIRFSIPYPHPHLDQNFTRNKMQSCWRTSLVGYAS